MPTGLAGVGRTTRPCHRHGCPNIKRFGRSFRYCSDECARLVELDAKRGAGVVWNSEHREQNRVARLWSKYRLTVEMFDEMVEQQGGRCPICEKAPVAPNVWHVDHDHACCPGVRSCGHCVRGLLCGRCNRHIMPVIENAALRERALAYLARSPSGYVSGC